jgi:hypothetical protein
MQPPSFCHTTLDGGLLLSADVKQASTEGPQLLSFMLQYDIKVLSHALIVIMVASCNLASAFAWHR